MNDVRTLCLRLSGVPVGRRRRVARLLRARLRLALHRLGPTYDGIDDAGIGAGIQADPSEATAAPLAIVRTNDLEQAEKDVLAAGGVITRAAFDFPGGRRFHFREPGGNELAVRVARE